LTLLRTWGDKTKAVTKKAIGVANKPKNFIKLLGF